ncbi:MAG: TonB-dependent receptor plug domain-containing protein [Microscillaceae bacterium]|nr:TonB-dependent receptor plug domain-containing protein [Microscillaceae bacterium]MDW8460373.1 TonB-dependent receptor plug domain-containing protein [Cytophagales bacterium]
MYKQLVCIVASGGWWLVALPLYAQMSDTLPAVRVYGIPLKDYTIGAKVVRVDSSQLARQNHNSLSDFLQQHFPFAIRQYGNGMLATIAFRGTSPNHTAVLWNGVNINSITLGQSDLATIPLVSQENISIHYGSASTLYGSDAIGGSIYLHGEPQFSSQISTILQQNVGSFGQSFSTWQFRKSSSKFYFQTKTYYQEALNNFQFRNFTKPNSPIERQSNAQIRAWGAVQEVAFQPESNQYLSAKLWYNDLHRHIQPSMAVNNATETQADKNLRLMLDYVLHNRLGLWNYKLVYIYDELFYDRKDLTISQRWIGQLDYEKRLGRQISLKSGANTQYIQVNTRNYAEHRTEQRTDFFIQTAYRPMQKLAFTLHLRQGLIGKKTIPLVPLLGSEIILLKYEKHQLQLKNTVSTSFRVPTLNERFWQPGGNPNILPEKGFCAEAGLLYWYQRQKMEMQIEATHYQNWVDNWIMWLPQGSFWSPLNIQKVHNRGAELSARLRHTWAKVHLVMQGQYAFTRATYVYENEVTRNFTNNQLPYVPVHQATFQQSLDFQGYNLTLQSTWTDVSYTSLDNLQYIRAFNLWHVQASKVFPLKQNKIFISLRINNLFNTDYQTYYLRAMPLRNFMLSIRYEFTKNL